MKKAGLIFILLLVVLLSLAAQATAGRENEFDEDEFDEWLIMEGEGLTILGAGNTTQQMEIIDRDTAAKTAAPDLPALLEEAAGLGVTRYGPYGNMAGVNLRGFDSKRVAVLVDGIPVNSATSGGFDYYSVDPLSIERIEVIKGGSDTKYNVSGALGGVINIVTVKIPDPGWTFGGSFSNTSYLPGSYRTGKGTTGDPQWLDLADSQNINLSGSYAADSYSINLGVFGNRAGNHFLYSDIYNFTRRKEGNEILDAGAMLSFLWNFDELSKFIASGTFYYGDKNIPSSGYAYSNAKQKDISSRENLMLDMPRAFHDNFSMELSLGHSWKKQTYGAASSHGEHNINLINRWSWFPGSKFTLRFGGDYRFINIDSTNTGVHLANRGGLYLTPEFSPAEDFLLIGSIKGITDGREIVPIPKLGWSWIINENVTLKNNYFRSFKFPDFDDLYWEQDDMSGNPDLKNEDGWGTDLGADFFIKDVLSLNSTVYGEWTRDSIHWSNMSGKWRPENYGKAVFLGLDNKADVTLPFSFWIFEKPVFNLSWIFQMSWLLTGELTFKDNKRIPYMPVHTLGASLEIPWKTAKNKLPGSLVVSGRLEGARFVNSANTIKLDPVFLANIVYNQKVHRNIGIFGKISNALNTSYVSYADYPMPGINITVGLNMNFKGSVR